MRRVEPDGPPVPARQQRADEAGHDAALGAVAMDDRRREGAHPRDGFPQDGQITRPDGSRDRQAGHAQREVRAHRLEKLVLECAAGFAVAQEADVMSCAGMLHREVADVAEDPAGRLAEAVKDPQALSVVHSSRRR